jgi:CelD/BcsL family acetyltransferase involved in cellulose biosynthesis
MTITVGEASAVGEIADEWDDLADRAGTSPFNRPGWIDAWWSAFRPGRLRIFYARAGGRLASVLPMYELRGTLRSPTNPHTPEFDVVALEDAAALAVTARVLDGNPRRVAEGTAARLVGAAAAAAGQRTIAGVVLSSPYIELGGAWEAFEASLSRDFRANLRRRLRNLEGTGAVSFEVHDGRSDLDGLLEEGWRVEAAGWKGREGTAIGSRPDTRAFYRSIAVWGAARGWLRLAFLRVDAAPAAFDLCLEQGGVHYLIKTGYDPRWARHSPGSLLRRHMIEDAFRRGLRSYEFLGDANEWKRDWTSATRERIALKTFSPTLAGRLDFLATSLDDPVTRKLRSALASLVRR